MLCESCPAYQAGPKPPPGHTLRGTCRLFPTTVPRLPSEWCMQHPARQALMAAVWPAAEAADPNQERMAV